MKCLNVSEVRKKSRLHAHLPVNATSSIPNRTQWSNFGKLEILLNHGARLSNPLSLFCDSEPDKLHLTSQRRADISAAKVANIHHVIISY